MRRWDPYCTACGTSKLTLLFLMDLNSVMKLTLVKYIASKQYVGFLISYTDLISIRKSRILECIRKYLSHDFCSSTLHNQHSSIHLIYRKLVLHQVPRPLNNSKLWFNSLSISSWDSLPQLPYPIQFKPDPSRSATSAIAWKIVHSGSIQSHQAVSAHFRRSIKSWSSTTSKTRSRDQKSHLAAWAGWVQDANGRRTTTVISLRTRAISWITHRIAHWFQTTWMCMSLEEAVMTRNCCANRQLALSMWVELGYWIRDINHTMAR